MKYSIFSAVACMLVGCMACTGNAGYKITGTVENAQEGDTVVLQEAVNGDLSPLETTVIRNGYFTFEGKQDSAIWRYITGKIDGREYMVDFFLENGNIILFKIVCMNNLPILWAFLFSIKCIVKIHWKKTTHYCN